MSFDTQNFYATKDAASVWTSSFWDTTDKTVTSPFGYESSDPSEATEYVGQSDSTFWYNGDGEFHMKGTYPRIYLNKTWKNVEVCVYYKRSGSSGNASDGCVIGVRSHLLGHRNSNYFRDTHTYYGRLRHDGHSDIAKEAHHAESPYSYPSNYVTWGDDQYRKKRDIYQGPTPQDVWIGWKYICVNIKGSSGTKILNQTWIDQISGGVEGNFDPSNWKLVESVVDSYGKIPAKDDTFEAFEIFNTDPNMVFDNSGIVFLRNGGVTDPDKSSYKFFSVHEISEIYEDPVEVMKTTPLWS